MWQELINLLNNDPTVSGIIASFFGNTLSTAVSRGLKKLFKKKSETKALTAEDCKQIISEEELGAILEEIKQLKNNKVLISQVNEEGRNVNEIYGLANATKNVEISQTNKKGDNSFNISF